MRTTEVERERCKAGQEPRPIKLDLNVKPEDTYMVAIPKQFLDDLLADADACSRVEKLHKNLDEAAYDSVSLIELESALRGWPPC